VEELEEAVAHRALIEVFLVSQKPLFLKESKIGLFLHAILQLVKHYF
jgi:hypothetical protein